MSKLLESKDFPYEIRFEMILHDVTAWCPETGAFLHPSHGRSTSAPRWFLFFSDCMTPNGDDRPYKEWRTIFRAWSREEAIAIANAKLAKLSAKGKAHVTGFMTTNPRDAKPWRNYALRDAVMEAGQTAAKSATNVTITMRDAAPAEPLADALREDDRDLGGGLD